MHKRVVALYATFSILAFLALSIWLTAAYCSEKTGNFVAATRKLGHLKEGIATFSAAPGGFASAPLKTFIRSAFIEDPTVEAVLVESEPGVVLYVFERHSWYITDPETLASGWKGTILYNKITEGLLTSDLPLPGEPHAVIKAVYSTLGKSGILALLRTVSLVVICFLLLTAIMLLLARPVRASARKGPPAEAADLPPVETPPPEAPREAARASVSLPEIPEVAVEHPPEEEEPSPEILEPLDPDQGPGESTSPERSEPGPSLAALPAHDPSGPPPAQAPGFDVRSPGAEEADRGDEALPPWSEEEPFEVLEPLDLGVARDAGPKRPSAEDELPDLDDFEDLERIDGGPSGALDEPPRAPRRDRPKRAEAPARDVPDAPAAGGEASESPDEAAAGASARAPQSGGGQVPYGLFSPETGLGWADYFEKRLSSEVGRAASFDQDLVVAIMAFAGGATPPARVAIAKQILIAFTFQDLCFQLEGDVFGVILPDTDVDQAIRKMESFERKLADEEPGLPALYVGMSARNGRLMSGSRLRQEAETAVKKALAEGRSRIVAFRVDPGKYREHIGTAS